MFSRILCIGTWPETFDEHLYIVFPGYFGELTEHIEFEELRAVIGIVDRTRTQTVAKRNCYVVAGEDLTDFIEMGVEEVFLIVDHGPAGHYRAAARHDAGQTFLNHVSMSAESSGMDGEVVHTLFCLLDQCVAIDFPGQILHFAVDFFKSHR